MRCCQSDILWDELCLFSYALKKQVHEWEFTSLPQIDSTVIYGSNSIVYRSNLFFNDYLPCFCLLIV